MRILLCWFCGISGIILAADAPPTISAIANQTALVGRSVGPFNFVVGDVDTPVGSLTVSGSSSNLGLVPNGNIVFFNIDGVTRTLTVTPVEGQVGSATITVSVSDGVNVTSTNFTFTVSATAPGTVIFNNASALSVSNRAVAGAYPSTLNVAGLAGAITKVTLTLKGLNHSSVRDLELLLVSPTGQSAVLFAHVGGGTVSNVTVTVDDAAAYALPPSPAALLAGTYRPLDAGHDAFPLPAPAGPYGTTLATFNGVSANGNWQLYVFNDPTGSGGGVLSGGWSLAITTGTGPTISDIGNRTILMNTNTGPIAFTVSDPDTTLSQLTFSTNSSNLGLVPLSGIALGGSGANRTVTVTPAAGQTGVATITVTVGDGTNSASDSFVVTVNAPGAAPTISAIANQTALVGRSVGPFNFVVGDVDTPVGNLTVSGSSSNPGLVVNSNIVFFNIDGVTRTLTVTPVEGQVGSATITVSVSDGVNVTSTNFTFTVSATAPGTVIFNNASALSVSNRAVAGAYPSTLNVAGLAGAITKVTLTLKGLNHSSVRDLELLLVSPTGQSAVLFAHVGGGTVSNVTVTLDDAAAYPLPPSPAGLLAGTYRPLDVGHDVFPLPAPAGPYGTTLATFNGVSANGNWQLYVFNDPTGSGGGVLSGGWSLAITTGTGPTISDIGNRTILMNTNTGPIAFTVSDPDTALNQLILSKSSSNVLLVPTNNIVLGGVGANRTVTVTPAAGQTGVATITVTVSDGTNSASDSFVVTVNTPGAAPTISAIANQTALVGRSVGPFNFVVGDVDTPVGNLTVSGSSSNPGLVVNSNIVFFNIDGATRTLTVTPVEGQVGSATITVSVSDGVNVTSTNFTFTVSATAPGTVIFNNASALSVSNRAVAGAYPSTLNVAGLAGAITKVTLTLKGLNHSSVRDLELLLVSPTGQSAVLFAHVGGGTVSNVTVTLDDAAAYALPPSPAALLAGTYRPLDAGHDAFPLPAPAGPYGTTLATFNGVSANGNWQLYVFNDPTGSGGGVLSGGWSLAITTGTGPTISDIGNRTILMNTNTGPIAFTVSDPDTALNQLILSKSSSNVLLVPTNNIVLGGVGANRTVTVTPAAGQTGVATITVTVSDGTNSASDSFVVTVNTPGAAPTISAIANQTALVGRSVGPFNFVVGDVDTPVGNLTVSGSSSNPGLVVNSNIVFFNIDGATRTLTVTPVEGQVGSATITVSVSDGVNVTSTNFTFTVSATAPGTVIFNNASALSVSNRAVAGAYPSTLNVAGLAGAITKVTLTLKGLNHSSVRDLELLLVSPTGQSAVLFAHVGGGTVSNVTVTLDDAAAYALPPSPAALLAGTYRPLDAGHDAFPLPAPAGPYGTTLATFNGVSANGNWQLYVFNDPTGSGGGVLSGGWSLAITTGTGPTISDIGNRTILMNTNTGPIAFTVSDPDTTLSQLTFSTNSSNLGLVPLSGIALGGSGANRTVTVTPAAGQTGAATITVTVSDGTNSASDSFVVTVNTPGAAPTISAIANQTALVGRSVGPFNFVVGDVDTPVGNLTVSGSSSNPGLVVNSNIVFFNIDGATRTLTVTPVEGQVGSATITVSVSDGVNVTSTNFTFTVSATAPGTVIFNNASALSVSNRAVAGAYPSTLNVAGLAGAITKVTLTLKGLNHSSSRDLELLLVSPTGQSAVLFAHVGGGTVSNVTVTLDDAAAYPLPPSPAGLLAGTYRPLDVGHDVFPLPAPAGPYGTTLATFNGVSANGNWQLYVFNDPTGSGGGVLSGGWSLAITTGTGPTISDIGNRTILMNTNTGPIAFTVSDPDTALNQLILSKSSSNVLLVPTNNIVLGGVGANRTVTVTPAAGQTGVATITVTVSDGTNSASDSFVVTVNAPGAAPTISAIANQTALVGRSVGPFNFVVGDVDTPVGNLTVSGSSSNPGLVVNSNIVFFNIDGATRTLTVTPVEGQVGSATITVSVSDGVNVTSTNFTFTVSATAPGTVIFNNASALSVSNRAVAGAYPSTLNVAGLAGAITKVTLTLKGLNHSSVRDLELLLVSPTGQSAVLFAHVGGGTVSNVTVTLDDAAAYALPPSPAALLAGTYRPLDAGHDAFPLPAPAGPYGTTLATFNGVSANGNWQLYVFNDPTGSGGGVLSGGWSLAITTGTGPTISDIGNRTILMNTNTGPIAFTVSDPDTALNQLILSKSSSNVLLVPTNNIVLGGVGANRTVTVTPAAGQTGAATITVTVSDGTNSASDSFVVTVNAPGAAPTISAIANQTALVGRSVGPFNFVVGDVDTPVGNLTVSGSSSNPGLVVNSNIVFFNIDGATRTLTVTPVEGQVGSATITVSVSDGVNVTSTNFTFTVSATAPGTVIFNNASALSVSNRAVAGAYPSTLNVAGLAGAITKVTLTLKGLNHSSVRDLELLLVSPTGQSAVLFAHVGGGTVSNVTVTLDDAAAYALPPSPAALLAGTYRPLDAGHDAFPLPAPAGPYGTTLATFNGVSANGNWQLYVFNDPTGSGGGVLSGGWSLAITTGTGPTISDIGNRTILMNTNTGPIAFTVSDPDTTLSQLTFSTNSSNLGLVPLSGIALGGSGANRTVTVTPAAGQTGAATITVTVGDGTNSASDSFVVTVNAPGAAPTISAIANQTALVGRSVGPFNFVVGDVDTPVGNLTVSGSSSNPGLVVNSNIVFFNIDGATRTLTVTPVEGQVGSATITVSVSDGVNVTSTNFTFTVSATAPGTVIFNNASALSVSNRAVAGAYPSTLNVAGLAGAITKVTLTLKGLNHSSVRDLELLLVSPTGQSAVLFAHVGGGTVSNVTVTVDDAAAYALPPSPAALLAGTYRPLDAGHDAFPLPAPAGPYGTTLATFNGVSANGNWQLYVFNDPTGSGGGVLSGGWSLAITTGTTPPTISAIPNQATLVGRSVGPFNFTVGDAETAAGSLTVSGSSSNPGLVPNGNIVFFNIDGVTRTLTVTPVEGQVGSATITVSVSDGENVTSTNFTFTASAPPAGTVIFNNSDLITIPNRAVATTYPSTLNVAGVTGVITNLTLTLKGLNHTSSRDMEMMLVSPTGQKAVLFAHVGGGASNVTVTLDDAAAYPLPPSTVALLAGTYRPRDEGHDAFPAPAPVGPYGTTLAAFNGISPNGNWSLYVFDDLTGSGSGSISGGWSLAITTGTASSTPPTVRILSLSVSSNLVLRSTGTNGWSVFPEYKTNLSATNWFALTVQTNRYANGTNETFCGKPQGNRIYIRIRSQPD